MLRDTVYRDGIVGLPHALPSGWADQLLEDFTAIFADAMSYAGGTVARGPHRYYLAVHPQRLRGFVDLVTHPSLTQLSELVLGSDYRIVELGFDVALPGAVDQPWHRDFPMPDETRNHGRLSSLAFNATTVDVTPDLAPFEIAPGTHWDTAEDFVEGMFPPSSTVSRYLGLGQRRYPRRGDISARSALALHRGTANRSTAARAVLVLGVTAADVPVSDVHRLVMTRDYDIALPTDVRGRLHSSVVEELQPIVQRHDIEGLLMGG